MTFGSTRGLTFGSTVGGTPGSTLGPRFPLDDLPAEVDKRRARSVEEGRSGDIVFIVDEFFSNRPSFIERLCAKPGDRVEFVEVSSGRYELIAATRPVTALKGMFAKPAKPVSIDEMNAAIAQRGAAAHSGR